MIQRIGSPGISTAVEMLAGGDIVLFLSLRQSFTMNPLAGLGLFV